MIRSTSKIAGVTLAMVVACSKPDADVSTTPSAAPSAPSASQFAVPPVASAAEGAPQKTEAPSGPLNVVLISIDCLRQDMPWAGYDKPIAPNLTKLAAESVVYTHFYSVSSYTAKAVAAFSTSRYPSTLYRSGFFFTDYAKSNTFLAEVLHEQGIRTMAAHAHLYFSRGKQLDQGFDVWDLVPGISFDPTTDKNVTSDKLADIAIKQLSDPANTGKPFFAWYHFVDPHDQYMHHAESPNFGKGTRAAYDGEVFFTDLHVGRLLDFVKAQSFAKNTAIIVTADHGEGFGEHGVYRHAFWLWDMLTRVPLFVNAPGATPKRIDEKRSHIDLAPTILELEGVKTPAPSFVGKSMVPEIYGAKPEDRDPIVLDLPEDSHNPQIRAIIRGNMKIIVYGVPGRTELYDLSTDPGELHDLAKTEPEKLAAMKTDFDKTWAGIPFVQSYGGNKMHDGNMSNGPMGPK
jgi:choline-sulfatase